jgi:hypothetical protein
MLTIATMAAYAATCQPARFGKLTGMLGLAAALTACATAPADPSKLSEGQLRALAADRSAVASCAATMTPWGPIRTTLVQLDRATIPAGRVTVGADCTVTIESAAAPPRTARAASAP